jgi:hypothetical protein
MSVALNSALARFYQEVRHDLTTAFENVGRLWDLFGMEVPSSSRSTMQAWLSDQPSSASGSARARRTASAPASGRS